MSHISSHDLKEFEKTLKEERVQLEKQLAEHGRNVAGDWQGTAKGFDGNEADPIDEADKMEELATNVPLVEELERRYKDVVDALAKIEAGSYGHDEDTGEPIAIERLRANPAARTATT